MEHHSNFVPWQQITGDRGAFFKVVELDEFGRIDFERIELELKKGVKLLAVTMASNVLGVINPIKELAALAHEYDTLIAVDGAQAVAHIPVDVRGLDVDFFSFSGHKVYGPTGIGALYGKRELLETLPPFLFGGEMISEVHIDGTRFNEIPYRFEAGTPPITEAIGLSAALDYVRSIGFDAIMEHEKELSGYALGRLETMPGITIYGPPAEEHSGVIAFNVDAVHPHDVAGFLGDADICIRAGHHCAQPLHEYLGIPASARASVGVYNSIEDMERFLDQLENVFRTFARAS
jgi:cysteine desulfurase/selenocysteine lyase